MLPSSRIKWSQEDFWYKWLLPDDKMWDSDAWYIWLMMLVPMYFMFISLTIIMIIAAYVRKELSGILAMFLPIYYPFIFVFMFWYFGPGKFFSHPHGYFYYFDVFWYVFKYLSFSDDIWYLVLNTFDLSMRFIEFKDSYLLLKVSICIYLLFVILVYLNLYLPKIVKFFSQSWPTYLHVDLLVSAPFFFFLFVCVTQFLHLWFPKLLVLTSKQYFLYSDDTWDLTLLYYNANWDYNSLVLLKTSICFVFTMLVFYSFFFFLSSELYCVYLFILIPLFFCSLVIIFKLLVCLWLYGSVNFFDSIFFLVFLLIDFVKSDESWFLVLLQVDNLWGRGYGIYWFIGVLFIFVVFLIFCDAWNYVVYEEPYGASADFFLYLPFMFMIFLVILSFIYFNGPFLQKCMMLNCLWPDYNYISLYWFLGMY